MKFSIIIPFKAVNAYVRETVSYVLKLNNADWELILVPNENMTSEWQDSRIWQRVSGAVFLSRLFGGDEYVQQTLCL
ncbi:MAG: hypothetical protein A2X40_08190 [Elusimicrobia bacterium GWC2_65_9]|nr:MAG: hypothetical protein A2X40_08190 [Elusimicrobia bacterium GWC2_65_9]OHC66073.1 MAG: hypothetical protein A2040_03785 [Rhodocyclales bacterium GWA2_65_19]